MKCLKLAALVVLTLVGASCASPEAAGPKDTTDVTFNPRVGSPLRDVWLKAQPACATKGDVIEVRPEGPGLGGYTWDYVVDIVGPNNNSFIVTYDIRSPHGQGQVRRRQPHEAFALVQPNVYDYTWRLQTGELPVGRYAFIWRALSVDPRKLGNYAEVEFEVGTQCP